MSAKKALESFYARQMKELERASKPRRRNEKPEADVKRGVLRWLKVNGFSCHPVESKAVYSVTRGRYLNSQATPGMSDIVGSCPNGLGCFIELKAPGRRSTLREGQRAFLMAKIETGAFSVVVDSVDCLEQAWLEFERRYRMEPQLAKAFLLRHLPRSKDVADLGFE